MEGRRDRGREGTRERGRERGMEGRREGGREGGGGRRAVIPSKHMQARADIH